MDSLTAKLFQSSKTVLTNKDLALLWQENDQKNLNAKTAYYVKHKTLIRLNRGVFTKSREYDPRELATSLYLPSYISFETALREAGVIFQHSETIFAAATWSKTIVIGKNTFTFRQLKDAVLYNPSGIINQNNYSIATPERAFLDMIYLFPQYYFDNLRSINWEICESLVRIYTNQQLIKRVRAYRTSYAQ